MEGMEDKKRRRQEKNKRRAQKKRARIAKAYNGTTGAAPAVSAPAPPPAAPDALSVGVGKKSARVNGASKIAKAGSKAAVTGAAPRDARKGSTAKRAGPVGKLGALFETEVDLAHAGASVLKYLISPVEPRRFMAETYERKPLLVQRGAERPGYFNELDLTVSKVRELLEQGKLRHNRDFTLTKVVDGARKTAKADTEAVASASATWKLFQDDKYSIRLLRPHNHSDMVWKLIAAFEGYWGCGGGANAYLTPRGSQGFAPHYDDIDAFILQLEGTKQWIVYEAAKTTPARDAPAQASKLGENKTINSPADSDAEDDQAQNSGEDSSEDEEEEEEAAALFPTLPLKSSEDFTREQVATHLKVAFRATLQPGDMLYLPRGVVHEAKASKDSDSLHITLSTGQHNSWADYIRLALTHAVDKACSDDRAEELAPLRSALPHNYSEYMGVVHSDRESDSRRAAFANNVTQLIAEHLLPNLDFDVIADRMAVRFQHDRHCPIGVLQALPSTKAIQQKALDGGGERDEDSEPEEDDITLNSRFVLAAKGVATLTVEADAAIVYHSCKNTRTYHETDPRGLEFDPEDAPTIESILALDPCQPMTVRDLEHPLSDADKIRVVLFLRREQIVHVL